MAQISYTNKVALNENPEILDINKVTDDDMNEIKQVVNDNYNNTIQITDTEPTDSDNKLWIDTGEVSASASEITNEYSESVGLGYSANYINKLINGTTLYEDSTGTNDVVTLSGSAANYDKIKIYYRDPNNFYSNVEVDNPNGKSVCLSINFINQNTARFLFSTSVCKINGTTITPDFYGNGNMYNAQNPTITGDKFIYITKVIGYKEEL